MKHRLYGRFRQVVDDLWAAVDEAARRTGNGPRVSRLTDIAKADGFLASGGLADKDFLLELGWVRGVADAEGWPTTREPGGEWNV